MSQHACQHMVSPPGKLPHLVMIHPQIRFGFLKALLDGPANSREPNEGFQSGGSIGVRDEVGISGAFSKGPAHDQPNRPVGLSVFAQNDPTLHKLVGHRPLRPLGDRPAIPEIVVRSPGDLFKGDRFLLGFRKDAFRPLFPSVSVGLLQNRRVLQPAEGVTRKRNKVCHPRNLFHRLQKLRAAPVNRIRHHVSERKHPFADDLLQHLHRQLRLRLERNLSGKPAFLLRSA